MFSICCVQRVASPHYTPERLLQRARLAQGSAAVPGSEKPLDILVEGLLYPNADSHRRLSLLAAATACPTGWTSSPASPTCFLVPPERSTSLFRRVDLCGEHATGAHLPASARWRRMTS